MEGIQVSTQTAGSHNQVSVIKVGGYIDTTTSAEVERSLNVLLKQGRYQIIIDLGNVDYISSAGWGIFISEIKSIRENNGDLKLVQMIPDVYEIFELLEFHHILDVYDSVQEAINKFEESQYVEMVSAGKPAAVEESPKPAASFQKESPRPARESTEFTPTPPKKAANMSGPRFEVPPQQPASKKPPMLDQASKSVEDKIRHIVAQNPDLGAYKINRRLNSTDYGFTRVGWFGVRSYLNRMDLNSRKKRRQYADKVRRSAV